VVRLPPKSDGDPIEPAAKAATADEWQQF